MMQLKQVIHRLNGSGVRSEALQEPRFWAECERFYTFQPIYRTDGQLMAIELLTAVTHPGDPGQRIPPDRYFSALNIEQRIAIVEEQLQLLHAWQEKFLHFKILASVNVDGQTLLAMKQHQSILDLVNRMPWVRFELIEHISINNAYSQACMSEFGPLWLDDFGTGMANFSALSEVRYDYIKIARDLFILLRESEEGRNVFTHLLKLMNRYCKGVIVEGVETYEEWCAVQQSPALAAQGYYLSRPVPFENLENLLTCLA